MIESNPRRAANWSSHFWPFLCSFLPCYIISSEGFGFFFFWIPTFKIYSRFTFMWFVTLRKFGLPLNNQGLLLSCRNIYGQHRECIIRPNCVCPLRSLSSQRLEQNKYQPRVVMVLALCQDNEMLMFSLERLSVLCFQFLVLVYFCCFHKYLPVKFVRFSYLYLPKIKPDQPDNPEFVG